MRRIEEINRELENLRKEMAENTGTTTEVYTRIVGYYRSVRNWNKGKREEYNYRKTFSAPAEVTEEPALELTCEESLPTMTTEAVPSSPVAEDVQAEADQGDLFSRTEGYLYFYRQTCPNCPPVKELLSTMEMEGTAIDVDTTEGLDAAGRWGVYAAPTVILLNEEGEEVFRSNKAPELEAHINGLSEKVLQEA